MMRFLILCSALLAAPATAQKPPDPLFASEEPIRLTIRGPFQAIARAAERRTDPHAGSLTLDGSAPETLPVTLSARGITRRRREVCTFPPIRLEFGAKPAVTSLFKGQKRLKLVTHCRPSASFDRYLLTEYAAYRLLNAATPLSHRVRLATVTYAGDEGDPVTRPGFLIEDIDDVARRNGLTEIDTGNVGVARLDPGAAARFAVFSYLIGNLDWSMHAGPPGAQCCHNSKLIGPAGASSRLLPIPYDFDHSGLVDAPYATPPPQVPVRNVRSRRYRGYCVHNVEAQSAAAAITAARPAMEAALDVPGLEPRARASAAAYLARGFEDIATPEKVADNLLRHCLR